MTELLSTSRRNALWLAIGLAVAGGLLLFLYVRGLESKALASSEPVEVLVAEAEIPAGTTAQDAAADGLVGPKLLPKAAVVNGSVTSVDELGDRAAIVDILAGEQIVADRFAAPTDVRGLLEIPADRQAISVEVGVPPGVAGFVEPTDRVSVIAKVDVDGQPRAQYLLQDVPVLAVGRRVVTSADGEDGRGIAPTQQENRVLLTLAIDRVGAEKLVLAIAQGEVWFTLLPDGQAAGDSPGRTLNDLFN